MIWKTLGITVDEALNGTTAMHALALSKGADILRVHDVREAVQVVRLVAKMKR
jgi:dihydropteroate synthase